MARSKQHRPQHPSSVRVRRAAHLERDTALKERKRLRRERRDEQAAKNISYVYRAADKRRREGGGWPVERWSADGDPADAELYEYASSRDGARKLAREKNAEGEAAA